MRIVNEAEKTIYSIWGKVTPQTQSDYRLMTYIIKTDVADGILLLNVVTSELIFLNKNESNKLLTLPCKYETWMDELIEKHFLVQQEFDDKKEVDSLRKLCRMLCSDNKDQINYYLVLPTTNCNARCFYCYESGLCDFKYENMSNETADKLVEFMEKNYGGKPIHIKWYGGEPLIGVRQIDRICKSLKEKSIHFESTLITNGYLITDELAERIKSDWNLIEVQITLDGTEKVYNEIKNYRNPCESPFLRVIDNIDLLLKNDIYVLIRLNIGLNNADDLIALADELSIKFHDKKNIGIYSVKLYEDNGNSPFKYSEEEFAELLNKENELKNHLKSFGKMISDIDSLPILKYYHCRADKTDSIVVTPKGNISVCEQCLNNHFVGNLDVGIVDEDTRRLFNTHIELYPWCGNCALYPCCVHLKMCGINNHCHKAEVDNLIDCYRKISLDYYKTIFCDNKNKLL